MLKRAVFYFQSLFLGKDQCLAGEYALSVSVFNEALTRLEGVRESISKSVSINEEKIRKIRDRNDSLNALGAKASAKIERLKPFVD